MESYREFFHQFMLMHRPFENGLNHVLSQYGLYRAQWSILYYLARHGSATPAELAHYQGVEKPTVTRTIIRLQELGFVRQIAGKDRREKRIQLTDSGASLYEEVRLAVDRFEKKLLEPISEEEQLAAVRIMKTVRSALDKENKE